MRKITKKSWQPKLPAIYPDRDSNASLILRRDPFYPTELSRQLTIDINRAGKI